jgi:hypothetical protein
MKQTAVEWLVEQLPERMKNYLNDSIAIAKEMEKEQIVQAITKTIIGSNVIYGSEYPEVIHTAEQYYTETYEQDKQG